MAFHASGEARGADRPQHHVVVAGGQEDQHGIAALSRPLGGGANQPRADAAPLPGVLDQQSTVREAVVVFDQRMPDDIEADLGHEGNPVIR